MSMLCVGVVQFAPVSERKRNWETASRLIEKVCAMGAKLVVLPELWVCEYDMTEVVQRAESLPGESTDFLAEIARRFGVWIVGGTVPERNGENVYNTCPVIAPSGDLIGSYRKNHLFKVNMPGRVCVNEGDVFTPGTDKLAFEIGEFRIGVGICFDLRFPRLALDYADDGCTVLVFPSAFTRVTGQIHWTLLGRARALDCQAWAVLVSSSFDETAKFKGNGRSLIANPMGEVVFELGDGEECGVFTIDMESVRTARAAIPVVQPS